MSQVNRSKGELTDVVKGTKLTWEIIPNGLKVGDWTLNRAELKQLAKHLHAYWG